MWYEFIPERDFTLKMYRHAGFPFLKVFKCNEDDYIGCLSRERNILTAQREEQMRVQETVKENGAANAVKGSENHQMVVMMEKNYQVDYEQCEKCIYFVWTYCFEGVLEMSVNLRTSSKEVELK